MANLCSFSMMVRGKHSDIEQFYNAMNQKGNIYMGRGGASEINYDDEEGCAFIDGWCKWSVQSAMIDNAISMRNEPNTWHWCDEDKAKELQFITLWEACERWHLDIDVYSEEPGCQFQEHYVYVDGEIVCEECVEYCEYYLDDYDTKEEAEEELGIEITDDEWEEGGYISRGGFGDWDFEI